MEPSPFNKTKHRTKMKTSLHHRIHGGINPLLAITLSVIALGTGILMWEWHGAHSHSASHHKHAKSSQHQHTKTHHTADAAGKSAKNG